MRILVTEVTGGLGRALTQSLLAAGHDVLQTLTADADAVLMLPREDGSVEHADVVRVCDAAARVGARIVFVSLALLEPGRWTQAEDLVSTGWAPNLVVRVAAPLGRQVDGMVCRTVAALLTNPAAGPVPVVHIDDLMRFLVAAAESERTGVVDLATPDTTTVASARDILAHVDPRPKARATEGWTVLDPPVSLTALREDWDFECAWGATESVADTVRGLQGRRLSANGAVDVTGRIPMPLPGVGPDNRADLLSAAPDGAEAEFDDRIDPRFPVFVAPALALTHSGPLTPMSLDLHVTGLRAAARAVSRLLDVPPSLAAEWERRLVAVFGHRVYLGTSVIAAAVPRLPGRAADLAARLCAEADADQLAMRLPTRTLLRRRPLSMARIVAAGRMLGRHVAAYASAADGEYRAADSLPSLSDAQLDGRIRLLRSRVHEGWVLTAQAWLLTELAAAPATGAQNVRIDAEIASLANVLRAHPYVRESLDSGDLDAVRTAAPMVGTAVDTVLAHIGHRGPGSAELAVSVIGDRPDAVIAAGERAMQRYPEYTDGQPAPDHAVALDCTLRFTHQLRLAVRELAGRRVGEDKLAETDDLFFLTVEEALVMPVDAQLRIKRRAAERQRLQAMTMPTVIDGGWSPQSAPDPVVADERLQGTGVVGGVFEGTVRVVRSAADAGLGPGDVAVITTADVESILLFGAPGGIVVDGAPPLSLLSRLGVPVLTGVAGAATRLVTGTRVRVDGSTGMVTLLADTDVVTELVDTLAR
ncbi:hypothetical protein [Mycobacterium sp. DL592]|uniref:hypothetical protein n=1 Tax=Mycobacterium sp. DL592 TaxID=2675524 RepID=UPI00141E148A|nr:hypothetical protein [Mycobacterium sp. DL592]